MKLPATKYRIMSLGKDVFYIESWHWWWPWWTHHAGNFYSLTRAKQYLDFWLREPKVEETIEVKR